MPEDLRADLPVARVVPDYQPNGAYNGGSWKVGTSRVPPR